MKEIRRCRYLLEGECILEEPIGESMMLNSKDYAVKAVIVDGTIQIVDLGAI